MIIDDPTIYYAVLAGKAFVLILGTIVLLSMWRQTRRVEQYLAELKHAPEPDEQQPDASKQHLIASLRLDKRISELQQQIAALSATGRPGSDQRQIILYCSSFATLGRVSRKTVPPENQLASVGKTMLLSFEPLNSTSPNDGFSQRTPSWETAMQRRRDGSLLPGYRYDAE